MSLLSLTFSPSTIFNDFTDLPEYISGKIVLASSLGMEDQVLTHVVRTVRPDIGIFVLDTGRLHQETYSVMSKTQEKYEFKYQVFFPDTHAVQGMMSEYGPNLFYESIEKRKLCCFNRKVEPLSRALIGSSAWITGQRRDQSVTRSGLSVIETDQSHGILKLNPLAEWSRNDIMDFIATHNIPYNVLHDRGFPSIGCAPCTRAVGPDDDVRSGRWWWEDSDKKECGLHIKSKG